MALLTLENITKSFDAQPVLRGVSLAVEKGEFVTLLGASGCGKTTTLRILSGLTAPDGGRVLLNGREITFDAPEKRPVNTVFQNYALFPHMNVERNIAYGLKIKGVKRAQRAERVREMLALVRLEGYEKRMPSQLSGGQRQRVAIARSVVLGPEILLLDEPLGALDLKLRRQMQTELKRIQQALGIAFIYITHDQEEALNMSDRIAVMNEGRIAQAGTPEDIYERPQTRFVASFIGEGALFDGRMADANHADLTCGRAAVAGAAEIPAGTPITVSVHAERICYSPSPVEGFDIPAQIISHRYAGAALKTELRLQREDRVILTGSDDPARSLPPVGTNVYVYWRAAGAQVIREAAEQ